MTSKTVNPVQTSTYFLTPGYSPITFGAATKIDAGAGDGVYGGAAASWNVTNLGSIVSVNNCRRAVERGRFGHERGGRDHRGRHQQRLHQRRFRQGHQFGLDKDDRFGRRRQRSSRRRVAPSPTEKGLRSTRPLSPGSIFSVGLGTVTNAGAIDGVGLQAGGKVMNTAGGTITGGGDGAHQAVDIQGASGTVINAGGITSAVGSAIGLAAGGSVTNESGGTISGRANAGRGHGDERCPARPSRALGTASTSKAVPGL